MSLIVYLLWRTIKTEARKRMNEAQKTDIGAPTTEHLRLDSPHANLITNRVEEGKDLQLLLVDFSMISAATNNFANENKIGKGGFGPVYKGKLSKGNEIAVKRLSKLSDQGSQEFKNEVLVLSKLQHRNLVRLLGCCIDGEENLLLYEFMPNNSLDSFLFDATKQGLLNWEKRYRIVEGIARGLLYLHRDSRLRIIHRDLKASNILLDERFDAKISDFGTARLFGGDQNLATTRRVIGTPGYISPEYAMEGKISEKSDVFSFGVLLLEIVSGKRNGHLFDHDQCLNLLRYAWKLWNEDRILALIDPWLGDSWSNSEVIRCITVGLLCVQESPVDRPTMSSVMVMLSSDASLPTPKQASFFGGRSLLHPVSSIGGNETCSVNSITVTNLVCR